MRNKFFFLTFLFLSFTGFSQEKKEVLFYIDNEPFYAAEFVNVYQKNKNLVENANTSIADYLELFVNYKLKIKEALALGLDTVPKFKNEFRNYKNSLSNSYLKDNSVYNSLLEEAYNRLKKEVKVSHILVFLKPNYTPNDTLKIYNDLLNARKQILNGESFESVAKKYSQDPTVEQNGGDLGYFTVFQMIYPFENAAYNTPVNQVSMPFKTKFGYHILKVFDVRDSKGEIEVAHIMLKDNEQAKKRIDSIYTELIKNTANFESFAKHFSEDRATAVNGGKLNRFTYGQMVDDFSKVAYSLQNEGDISAPFKTQYGWHIVKLLQKYPVKSFEDEKQELQQKLGRNDRLNMTKTSILHKLENDYKISVNDAALKQFYENDWKLNSGSFNKNLLNIEGKKYTQTDFINFLKKSRYKSVNEAFDAFKEEAVLNFYKQNLEANNPDFSATLKEFKEGLLLFDLLEKEVWNKSKNTKDVQQYFEDHKQTYQTQSFDAIKGKVITDYQNYLEENLVKELKNKYSVKFNEKVKETVLNLKL